ncbi:MAG: HD domain-containing protein [bacterium]|nr:HD domain-containing protein [bacterium]
MQTFENILEEIKTPIFLKLMERAKPFLISGRSFDLVHTEEALYELIQFLKLEKNKKLNCNILIPAMIFHDCGWSKVPKKILNMSYGNVKNDNPGKIIHQVKGASIAKKILKNINYDSKLIDEICHIVSVHDNPKEYKKSKNAIIVAETDKLVRYGHFLFYELIKIGIQTLEERIIFLEDGIDKWFSVPEYKVRARFLLDLRCAETSTK